MRKKTAEKGHRHAQKQIHKKRRPKDLVRIPIPFPLDPIPYNSGHGLRHAMGSDKGGQQKQFKSRRKEAHAGISNDPCKRNPHKKKDHVR